MRMLPTPSRCAALAALALALAAAPASTFDMPRHSRMTEQTMARLGVTGAAQGLIAWGALLPDLEGCVRHCYCDLWPWRTCAPDSATAIPFAVDHFDNNLLDESVYRINDNMAIAQGGVWSTPTGPRAAARALVAFGRALHTTQDFYAHSTFLEINLPLVRGNPLNLPLWQGQPYALFPWTTSDGLTGGGGLETGYYLQALPFGAYTHDMLNKDNAGTGIATSAHGQVRFNISVPSAIQTTLYGLASGDLRNDGNYTEYGLATRHTVFAYDVLLNGGYVFPYIFGPTLAEPADPVRAQRVIAFFDWVNANPELIDMAATADSLVAHAERDSLDLFPMNLVDAEGLPLPYSQTAGASAGAVPPRLAVVGPNPFTSAITLRFVAAAPGVYLVRMTGFGREEARRVALAR